MSDLQAWVTSVHREARTTDDGSSAVLHRRYGVGIDDMWSAWTKRERLSQWFGPISGTFKDGGTVEVEVQMNSKVACEIQVCEAPTHLVVTWHYAPMPHDPLDRVELHLTPLGGQTLLSLEHHSVVPEVWHGVGPGWEDWLYRLDLYCSGGNPSATPSAALEQSVLPIWQALHPGS